MLFLTPQDIEYCEFIDKEVYPQKNHSGIFYKGFFFFQVACFTNDRLEQAILRCRQFLEGQEPITSIIVQEQNKLTLWSEIPEVNLILQKQKLISETDNSNINYHKRLENSDQKTILKYRGITIIKSVKKISQQDNNSTEKNKSIAKKNIIKYRGKEVIEPPKKSIVISREKLEKHKNKLKYRGANY